MLEISEVLDANKKHRFDLIIQSPVRCTVTLIIPFRDYLQRVLQKKTCKREQNHALPFSETHSYEATGRLMFRQAQRSLKGAIIGSVRLSNKISIPNNKIAGIIRSAFNTPKNNVWGNVAGHHVSPMPSREQHLLFSHAGSSYQSIYMQMNLYCVSY